MTRGKNLLVALAVAGTVVLGIGASSTPASAQVYPACAPGYYYAAGYCYPYSPTYYPPTYYNYGSPFFYPSIGLGFGFGRGFHRFDRDDFHGGLHRGGFHGGGFHGGGFHGGGHR
jgi:hypothetical protein